VTPRVHRRAEIDRLRARVAELEGALWEARPLVEHLTPIRYFDNWAQIRKAAIDWLVHVPIAIDIPSPCDETPPLFSQGGKAE